MGNSKEKLKKFSLPVEPSTLLIIGYIFAFFATMFPDKRKWGILLFIATFVGHIFYLLSPEQKAVRLISKAKKLLDKGDSKEGAKLLIESAKLSENRDNLYKIFKGRCKNVKSYKEAARIMEKHLNEIDTPFFRLLTASMFYYAGNVKKTAEILEKVPYEKRDIKIVRMLGSALFDMNKFDKSIEVLKEFDPPVYAMSEDELAVQFGLGIAYARKGDLNKAIEYLEKVEQRNSRFGNVSKILESLYKETEKGS
ncbi:MAG: hypothetical protein J7L03_02510 [Caldisericaceae bacterium]|nr:hypothetical protein [Caldisericaceae bacterium]